MEDRQPINLKLTPLGEAASKSCAVMDVIVKLQVENALQQREIELMRKGLGHNELTQYAQQFFAKAFALMQAKNADYAQMEDPLLNFTLGERLGVATTEQGVAVRWFDKLQRTANLLQRAEQVATETIEDTLLDWANYAAILAYALKKRREANGE